jgi:uncharacterized protein YciI
VVELVPHTVVLLVRPPDAPHFTDDELSALQEAHLDYMASLRADGKLAANGPFVDQDDDRLRGFCVFAVGPDEARALVAEDPSVRAGRLAGETFTWLIPEGLARFGP